MWERCRSLSIDFWFNQIVIYPIFFQFVVEIDCSCATHHTSFPLPRGWFFFGRMVGRWREPLGSFAQCRDSRRPRRRPMTSPSRPGWSWNKFVKKDILYCGIEGKDTFVSKNLVNVCPLGVLSVPVKLTSLTSLMSPTSRCFPSTPVPFSGPRVGPATGGHLDVIVPAPSPPSVKREKRRKEHKLIMENSVE